MDATGEIISQRSFATIDGHTEYPIAIIPTAEGGFATLSRNGHPAEFAVGLYVDNAGIVLRKFRVSSNGTLVQDFAKVVERAETGPYFLAHGLAESPDGGFLVYSTTPPFYHRGA